MSSASELLSVHHDTTKMSAMMLQGLPVCKNITISYIDVRYELSIKYHVYLKILDCCLMTGYCCLICPVSFWRERFNGI